MASNGSTTVAVTNWDNLVFSWEVVSQSAIELSSVISWSLKLVATSSGRIDSSASKAWSVTINGTTFSGTNTVGIGNKKTQTLASGSMTLAHVASTGARALQYSFSQEFGITFSGNWIGTISGEGESSLPVIARASQPSCITWPEHTQNVGYFGDTINIFMNRVSGSGYTHRVRYQFGSQSGTIATGVTNDTTWTIPKSLMNLIPKTTKGSGTIYVDTYNGSTFIGTKYCGFTAEVPNTNEMKPSCTVTITDTTNYTSILGNPVKGLSRLKVTVSSTSAYSSPIVTHTINGETYGFANSVTKENFDSGTFTSEATVTDARGRTSDAASASVTVIDYSKPVVTLLNARRCNSDGTNAQDGAYCQVEYSASISSLGNQNTASYVLKYKKSTATAFTSVSLSSAQGTYIFPADVAATYNIELVVSDRFFSNSSTTSVSTAFTHMYFGWLLNNMGLGKIASKDGYLEIGFKIEVEDPIEFTEGGKHTATLTERFIPYENNTAYTPWYRKTTSGLVEICGTVSPQTGLITGEAFSTIFTLPEGYRPAVGFYEVCQASGACKWLISVSPDGKVNASRYSEGGSFVSPPNTAWMPFHVCFIADQ